MQSGFYPEKCLGYAQFAAASIDAAALVSSLTFSGQSVARIPPGTQLLTIQNDATAAVIVRWRDDGTAPTAAIGYQLAAGAELRYTAQNFAQLRFIGQAPNAVVNIMAYGTPSG